MDHIWQGLRTGHWLDEARARGYAVILLVCYALAIVGWVALSDGLNDRSGKPLGTDFASFYAAGRLVLEGRAADVYDMAAHHLREQQIFGPQIPYYAFFYPPLFLLIATPLALLPYLLALVIWQAATLALYLVTIFAILRQARETNPAIARLWLLAAVAAPAVFVNLGHGQNGLLSAGLLGAALLILPQRPAMAGVMFGLLAYKPQFGVLIPFALLAAGRWTTIATAALTVLLLAAVSCLAFGLDPWWLFLRSTETSRRLLLDQGEVGFEKLQSVFAAVRLWGGTTSLAWWLQGATTATVIGTTMLIWRSVHAHEIRAATLIIAGLLASPLVLDYDLTMLAPATAFLVVCGCRHGFRDFEISLLATAWLVPLMTRSVAGLTGLPLGLLLLLLVFAITIARAAGDRAGVPHGGRLAQA